MKEMELKELLMAEAREGGICAEGYSQMRGYDRDGLVDFYVANPDWGMERGFPSLEILRSEFSDCEEKGVYVGRSFNGEVLSEKQAYIFHDCKGTIKVAMDYDNAVIPMLYFANGCEMRVECEQRNDPAINVPLYIAEGGSGLKPGAETNRCKVVGAKTDNCNFKRKTIKLIKR